jgi:hypothetical protein
MRENQSKARKMVTLLQRGISQEVLKAKKEEVFE